MPLSRLLITTVLVGLGAASLSAHDFWLAAANWTPPPGSPVTITAGIGETFPTRTQFRVRGNWLEQWRILGADGDVQAAPDFRAEGVAVATDVVLPGPGAYLAVAAVRALVTEMKGPAFTEYLKEESLDRIIAARAAAGETDATTKEIYARYAKVAIRTGAGDGAHLTRPAGLKAEFIPAADPTAIRPGRPLTLQLVADGRPVAGAVVAAVADGAVQKATTDDEGRVTFTPDRPGAWLVKTVHMVRLPPGSPADWESYWVTLAFHTAGD